MTIKTKLLLFFTVCCLSYSHCFSETNISYLQGTDYKMALELIDNKIDINAIDPSNGATLLHGAAMIGKNKIIKLLLKNGANINSKDFNGETPLHYAVSNEMLSSVKLLIKLGAKLDIKSKWGKTPVDNVYLIPDNKVLKYFKKTKVIKNVKNQKIQKQSLYELITMSSYKKAIKRVKHDISDLNTKDPYTGNTPLHNACWRDYKLTKALIEAGADINAKNDKGETPLFRIASREYLPQVKLFLKHKVDINIKNKNGETAVFYCDKIIFPLFVKYGADLTIKNKQGHSLLHLAAKKYKIFLVKYILEHKLIDVDIRNKIKQTPFHIAVEKGNHVFKDTFYSKGTYQLFLKHNANINAKDTFGKTPIFYVNRKHSLDAARILLKNGADINAQTPNGYTPLLSNMYNFDQETLTFFLANGADPLIQNRSGEDAYDIAIKKDKKRHAKIIKNHIKTE